MKTITIKRALPAENPLANEVFCSEEARTDGGRLYTDGGRVETYEGQPGDTSNIISIEVANSDGGVESFLVNPQPNERRLAAV